ncbi:MAG: hyaluronoglucosaminidase [Myxococcota bacterium]
MSLGIIEGFYGETWGWRARTAALPFLAEAGFTFFIYAPKSDRRLRREWRTAHNPGDAKDLRDFGAACRAVGIGFGVGLTPLALHEEWDGDGRADLERRLSTLKSLRLDWLGVLFDDMRGDMPRLAQTQADIVKVVADAGVADNLMMCPTYYSDASILDRLFGDRPAGYLGELGRAMDNEVGICWTGEKVVSETYTATHLDRVANEMGQKPLIWDNYPVNDGPRMSRFLHLAAPDRGSDILPRVDGLMMNPMNQSWLSRIPMLAAAESLQGRGSGSVDGDTARAIRRLLPVGLAGQLTADWRAFQETGMEKISTVERDELIGIYTGFDHPAAAEIVRWLKGDYAVSSEILTDV